VSESDIDMDRAMQGIDDADSHVPEITWTNCADAMPPGEQVIARVGEDGEKSYSVNGSLVANEYNKWKRFNKVNIYWTPYTPEKWKELKNE